MSKEYELLKKLYRENEGIKWNLACTWLLDNGFKNVRQWDDEFINNQKAPELLEKDLYIEILKLARLIATKSYCLDFMRFCMVHPFIRIDNFANKLDREKLENMIKASLSPMSIMDVEYNLDTKPGVERVCEKYQCEAEDLELLGYTIPDDYWR